MARKAPKMANGDSRLDRPEGFWLGALGVLKRLDQDAALGVIVLGICVAAVLKGAETIPTYLLGLGILALFYLHKWFLRGRKDV